MNLIPFFRWQKRNNEAKGIVDCDSDFFVILKEQDDNAENEETKAASSLEQVTEQAEISDGAVEAQPIEDKV